MKVRLLDRYIYKEVLAPSFIGFLVYTLAILLNKLVLFAEIAVKRDVSAVQILNLLVLSLPHIAVLTVPMAFLVGILIAMGRLSADLEFTALKASGVSNARMLKPILHLAGVFTLITLFLTLYLMPLGNTHLRDLQFGIVRTNIAKLIEPKVFFEGIQDFLLYVDQSAPGDPYVRKVFISEYVPGISFGQTVTFADTALLSTDEKNQSLIVQLENCETHIVDPRAPLDYQLSRHQTQVIVPRAETIKALSADMGYQLAKGLREQTLSELAESFRGYEKIDDEKIRRERLNAVKVEIHKKFAIPVACLVFALLGFSLGLSNYKGGKISGFIVSIAVFIVYWIFLWGGEKLAVEGRITPFWAMWSANIFFAICGLLYLFAMSYGGGAGAGISRVVKKFVPTLRQPSAVKHKTASVEKRLLGSTLIASYVLRFFFVILVVAMVSLVVLFFVAELIGMLDEFMSAAAPPNALWMYIAFSLPRLMVWTLPISVLVSVMVVLSILARNNELIAMRAAGISSIKVAAPICISALVLCGALFLMQEFVLPQTNSRADQLKDTIRGRSPRTYARPDRQWIFGENNRLYNYAVFNPLKGRMQGIHVFLLDRDAFSLKERIFARSAVWNEERNSWLYENGWIRKFDGGEEAYEVFEKREFYFTEPPAYFERERWKSPDTMNFIELNRYIRESQKAGYQVRSLKVNLHKKFSFVLIPFIFAMLGVPFALWFGKRGALFGAGLSIAISAIYYGMLVFTSTLGMLGILPPSIAAWAANIMFGAAAVLLLWASPT